MPLYRVRYVYDEVVNAPNPDTAWEEAMEVLAGDAIDAPYDDGDVVKLEPDHPLFRRWMHENAEGQDPDDVVYDEED